jgi:hypothetical protein
MHYKTLYASDRSAFAAMGIDSFADLCSIELTLTALSQEPISKPLPASAAEAAQVEADRNWLYLLRAKI